MSKESLQKFVADSRGDKKLQDILENARKNFASKEARFENISKQAKEMGYDFTVDDMLNELERSSISGFSDDELAEVSGGAAGAGGFFSSSREKKVFKNFMQDIIGRN